MLKKLTDLFLIEYTDVDDILDKYKDEIETIKYYVGSETLFDAQYLPIIRNYAEFVYTLPASEYHHHKDEYGLFVHGLETALNSIQFFSARGITVRDAQQYEIKKLTREEKKRWRLALFAAAILHDIGKVIASMTVSVEVGKQDNGGSTHKYWMSIYEPLFVFLDRESNYNYKVEWIKNRGVNHEAANLALFYAIVPANVTRNLGIDKVLVIMDAITPMSKPENVLTGLIQESDHRSAEQESIHIIAGGAPSSAGKPKAQQSKKFEQASTLSPKTPTAPSQPKKVLAAPKPKDKARFVAPDPFESGEPTSIPQQLPSSTEKKEEKTQSLSMETFVASLRELVCEGKVEINNANHAAFMLLNKQAGWINTQALNRILKNIGLDKIHIKHHEYIETLIKEGCISTIGESRQNSVKAKVGKTPHILFAVVKKVTGVVTDISENYSGELKMPGKLQLNVIGLPQAESIESQAQQNRTSGDFIKETIKVVEKVLAQAGNVRVVTIEKRSFDDFIKKEVGAEAAPLVKKNIRKNSITSLDKDKIKFSALKAKEFINREKSR